MASDAIEKRAKLLGLDEAASTLFESPKEQESHAIFWDVLNYLTGDSSKVPDLIEEKLNQGLNESSNSKTDSTGKPETSEEETDATEL